MERPDDDSTSYTPEPAAELPCLGLTDEVDETGAPRWGTRGAGDSYRQSL